MGIILVQRSGPRCPYSSYKWHVINCFFIEQFSKNRCLHCISRKSLVLSNAARLFSSSCLTTAVLVSAPRTFGPCPILQQTKLLWCFLPCCSLNDHWPLLVGRRRLLSPLCGFWSVFPCRVSDSVLVVIPVPACKESTFRPWSVVGVWMGGAAGKHLGCL